MSNIEYQTETNIQSVNVRIHGYCSIYNQLLTMTNFEKLQGCRSLTRHVVYPIAWLPYGYICTFVSHRYSTLIRRMMVFRGPKLIVGSKEIVETPRSYRKVAAWSLCSICKITQIPAATPSWPQLNNVTALQSINIFRQGCTSSQPCQNLRYLHTHTHNIYTMIKSQTIFFNL